ncbi:MAG: methyl-accepting chemotaxis protein [Waterburya sp.]
MNKYSENSETKTVDSWWQYPRQIWNNIPLRNKTTILLITVATIPVIAVTQGIVQISKQESLKNLEILLDKNLTLLEEEINVQKSNLEANVNTLALSVQAAEINLEDANTVAANSQKLQSYIEAVKEQKSNASFYLITDAQGRTVAQFIQQAKDDGSDYPLLPTETTSSTKFQPISLTSGISLGDVPIVKNALELSRPLSGFELLSSDVLKRIGLNQQANIGVRYQDIEGLPEPKKPYPEDTFDIDGGKAGFVLMAVKPIRLDNNQVGTAIVGTLVNRNFEIVDRLKEVTGVSTATIFAQDWRVSTNVPYTDNQTRAIGTRVSRIVADTVLNKKQVFLGDANIIGIEYVTGYSPIYNHLQQINGEETKPIGIAYVGEPQTQVAQSLGKITLAGYTVGGVVLIIVITTLILAPSDKSLPRLTEFATQIASGKPGVRLDNTKRQDEIGILTHSLNEMAKNIDANIETKKREAEQQRQEKEQLEAAIYTLIDEVSDATEGDLTVRANLDSLELSTVADLFNAIITNLQEIAVEAKHSTNQVGSSLKQNETAILALAEQAIAEAQETRDTLVSVEQMSQSIREVAENASQAEKIADDTYNTIVNSTDNMNLTVNSILELRNTVGETAKKMKRLGESSQKISQAVSFIEEIALKTNVLAINASVEAGRAGEYGQGFTIVAEQVGALAAQSATATKQIASIVAAIQAETQEVSQAMEAGTTQVVESTKLVEVTKESLRLVLEKSQTINQLMESISQTTVTQAHTSQNVTSLMQKIAQLSEITSKSSKEVAQSIVATAQVAQKLESTVAQFKVAQ